MLRWALALILTITASLSAMPSFEIGQPSFGPAQARFVMGAEEGFYTLNVGFLTRVTRDGTILDPASASRFPSIALSMNWAAAGAGLVVASCQSNGCLRTVAVTADGQPAWTVENLGGSVLFDGTNFVILHKGTEAWRATVVDRTGAILRHLDVPDTKDALSIAVAPVRDGLLFSWIWKRMVSSYEGYYCVSAVRVSSGGSVGTPVLLETNADPFDLTMASSGEDALIVFKRAFKSLYVARVDHRGFPLGISAVDGWEGASFLRAAWDGARYRVAWQTTTDNLGEVFVADVDPKSAELTGLPVRFGVGDARNPRLAVSGNQLLVSYDAGSSGGTYARFLHTTEPAVSLLRSEPVSIYTRARSETAPAITWSGDHYVVVWARPTVRGTVLLGQEFLADGTAIAPPVPIVTLPPDTLRDVGIASVGEVTLLIWTQETQLKALRLARGFIPLESPVTIAAAFEAVVAASESEFAVAWRDPGTFNKVYARLIDAHRPITVEPPLKIAEYAEYGAVHDVLIAWGGTSFVVTHSQFYGVPCDIPIGAGCGAFDGHAVELSPSGQATLPHLVAKNILRPPGLGRSRNGVVYYACNADSYACSAVFLSDAATSSVDLAQPASSGYVQEVLWNGKTFVMVGGLKIFRFLANGSVLSDAVTTPGSSFPVQAPLVVAASSGDGRTMILFLTSGTLHGAILRTQARRRAAGLQGSLEY